MYRFTLLYFALISVLLLAAFGMTGCGEEEEPPTAEELTQEGWSFYEEGNYESAKGEFEEATRTDSSFAEAYVGLGWAYGKTLNLQESISNFQNALNLEPQNVDAHAGIAFANLADDKYEQAIASADQALAINPGYSFEHGDVTSQDLNMVKAESYYYMGDFESAQAVLGIECSSEGDCAAELLEALKNASGN